MARIRARQRADGGTSYNVYWIIGGGRSEAGRSTGSETFTDLHAARRFKLDVEHAGELWPPGWVKGRGYVKDEPAGAEPDPDVLTVDAAAESYWTTVCAKRVARGRLERDTLHKYTRIYALHLAEHLGHLAVRDVMPADVEGWVDAMLDESASPKSIRNWHGLLFSVLAHGAALGRTGYNAAAGTDLPADDRRARRRVAFLTHAEWPRLRALIGEDAWPIVDSLLATGMRWGEASALRVGDVAEAEDGDVSLHIQRAWGRRSPDDPTPIDHAASETVKWRIKTTKSGRDRYAIVSGAVADTVRAAAAGRPDDAYLFGRRGPWRYEDFHFERWAPATRAAALGRAVTIHGLRHTFVVWALAAGVSLEKVSDLVGHSSIQITHDVYGGLLDLRDPAAARAMAKAMAG